MLTCLAEMEVFIGKEGSKATSGISKMTRSKVWIFSSRRLGGSLGFNIHTDNPSLTAAKYKRMASRDKAFRPILREGIERVLM